MGQHKRLFIPACTTLGQNVCTYLSTRASNKQQTDGWTDRCTDGWTDRHATHSDTYPKVFAAEFNWEHEQCAVQAEESGLRKWPPWQAWVSLPLSAGGVLDLVDDDDDEKGP